MNTYINMDGVENVSVMLVKHARRDFIKGGKVLYRMFGRIPDQKEFYASSKKDTRNEAIRWMYDAWRFIHNDPYSMFGDVGEEAIINQWKTDTIMEYYKERYLPGATELYLNKKEGAKKEIYELSDNLLKKQLNKEMLLDFIDARNYILATTEGKSKIKEWNSIAYERSKKKKRSKGTGHISIERTKYHQEMSRRRIQNIERAKELYLAGISKEGIAKELGVTMQSVNAYLRS